MLIIGVVASAIGIAVALSIDWFPKVASTQAEDIDTLFDILLIASVPVFVLVEVVVLFSVWKFRMRPGEELKDGPPIHGNTLLEVIWTAIPALTLVGLCAYAYIVLQDIEESSRGELVVNVTGEQFAWTFEYPGQDGGPKVRSDQLYLPEGEKVKFNVRSKDVIHDFWVPEFRQKIDAVPGITAPTPWSAPSCAAWDTPRCGRPCTSSRPRISSPGCRARSPRLASERGASKEIWSPGCEPPASCEAASESFSPSRWPTRSCCRYGRCTGSSPSSTARRCASWR
jgi:heme/copper-type cytochrome/quinol oxidase subunit 2